MRCSLASTSRTARTSLRYIKFFDEERPSSALGYLTSKAYREMWEAGKKVPKKPSKIKYEKKQKKIEEAKAKASQKLLDK